MLCPLWCLSLIGEADDLRDYDFSMIPSPSSMELPKSSNVENILESEDAIPNKMYIIRQ